MQNNEIEIILTGSRSKRGEIQAKDLLTELSAFLAAIGRIKTLIDAERSSVRITISHISRSSPTRIVLAAEDTKRGQQVGVALLSHFVESIAAIQTQGSGIPDTDPILLEELKRFASPVGNGLQLTTVKYLDDEYEITKRFSAQLGVLLAPETASKGFIRGMLEQINIHRSANSFRLYPDIGPPRVTCHFPEHMQGKAIKGVGHHVEVHGLKSYRPNAKFPFAIEVEEIFILPTEDSLPSLSDIEGMAPDLTGDKHPTDFIRDIRDAEA